MTAGVPFGTPGSTNVLRVQASTGFLETAFDSI